MEMPDDCFMSASIASVTVIDGKRGEEGTEDYDSGLSVKMIISSTLRDGVVCKDSCVCVCVGGLSRRVCSVVSPGCQQPVEHTP